MSSVTKIERNIELNFTLEKVKKDIERVVKNGSYVMHSKNDILNTYYIGKVAGVSFMSMLVTLKSLENGNSNIHIEVNTKGAECDQRFVERMIDTFLERLIKPKDDERRIASTGNKGCMVAILSCNDWN
jgi:hypothetical protein